MWNAKLDESQAGNKIARRNINNLRDADDTTLMAESEDQVFQMSKAPGISEFNMVLQSSCECSFIHC